ncbi:type I DNA topoisomerase [Thiohalophilus thiocyanatoxydans]|uniref:DNA topoisomerase 1 n=1 Tax=Thiohalophilus thiocyanatoxydans TaxID=381308 RepID=A0A4R8IRN5_9GAMM|nr:type I DNA topoisomerase [Thiohalophilus thiocyanatoxydans]TDY03692.1 DNA topoisomerase-1 [Thiohalophilus thiocyanatoxydans]
MAKSLVIVESPAKAKTIKKYLGKDYEVLASYGHVRDLLPKEGAVDPEHDFAMKYQLIEKNEKHIDAIIKSLKKADNLYLATDPDREGEAIAWHLYEILKDRDVLNDKHVGRVAFNEITKSAVNDAVSHPRELSDDLIHAQLARRALDYLVGFNLSPLLWKKIRRGLSAGRVQSPALRLIVEREIEIENFKPKEYWSMDAEVEQDKQAFTAKLTYLQGKKVSQFTINNEKKAKEAEQTLSGAANGKLTVHKVEKKQRKRNPAAPFTTSTVQQEASRKLGFTARKTMSVAQQLYEGIDLGGETVGLITYMRTDSVNLADEALTEIRQFIQDKYGADNLPKEPRQFKTKSKNAQEAHEAIRPTSVLHEPAQIKKHLSKDQFRLYELIWKRTVACQMIHATMDTVAVDLAAGSPDNLFRANGSTVVKPGFMALYLESEDDSKKDKDDKDRILPPMKEGDVVELLKILPEQHFTEPPPRYSEASLVKALEEYGIGRPSTYASIISTLQQREYVEMDKKRFIPTDVGRIVNKFLTEHFPQYVDYEFTAHMEDDLDAIARGEKDWVPMMKDFWKPFHELVEEKDKSVDRKDVTHEQIDEKCPKCGGSLAIRLGRRGRFIGCNNYPECDYTRNVNEDANAEPEVIEGRKCPDCESDLIIRHGRYGKFIGCSGYPDCRYIEPLEKPENTGVQCPECKQGSMLKRKARSGKIFFSCERYPDCKYAVWNQPLNEACPQCGWPMLTLKTTKRRGTEKVCPQKECNYSEQVETEEEAEQE